VTVNAPLSARPKRPLALVEDDVGDEAEVPQAHEGVVGRWRNMSVGLALVCVTVTGAVVISCSPALRARSQEAQGAPARSRGVLQQRIEGVAMDAAGSRRMERPPADLQGSPDADAFEFEPHPVEWAVTVRKEAIEILESQKFRLLKHLDGRITLRDQHGFHLDVADNRIKMKGGVTTHGVLLSTPIKETGKFAFQYNFDNTISLRLSNYTCLTSTAEGLFLLDCDANDGAGSTFTPTVLESEGVVAFKTTAGKYLTVYETWVQNYKTSLVMVNETVAQKSPSQCANFRRSAAGPDHGLVALKTRWGSYLTAAGGEALNVDAAEVGPEQMFTEIKNDDGSVSLSAPTVADGATGPGVAPSPRRLRGDNSPRLLGLLEDQSDGTVRASGHNAGSADSLVLQVNSDGTVSLTKNGSYMCAAERSVTVATCETRKTEGGGSRWPMQGVDKTMTIQNVCAHEEWYGFKTKVDAYQKFVGELADSGEPDQMVVLVDNSDMAFGGCSYDELLHRYDIIRDLTGATVIAGADNAPFPTSDWPYDSLQDRRNAIMKAFGMSLDQYCDVTDCLQYAYKYANSGFLMGPPRVLYNLLGCMLDKGFGHFWSGATSYEYDDQQGLQACMFGEYQDVVALDYSGTLTMELIRMDNSTLYKKPDGKVYNSVARGMPQCFVHGNGDTLKSWWPRLFPGMHKTEDYGKDFAV
jgi:hypothetical protein